MSVLNESQNSLTNSVEIQSIYKSYILFWLGQRISLLGSSIVMFTIIWFITDIAPEGRRNFYLSLVSFSSFIPVILLSPIAGVVADQFDKKKVIFFADSFQALTTLILFLLFKIPNFQIQIWHIIIISTLRSVGQAFHEPVVFATLPLMVPKTKISRLQGMNYLFNGIVQILGPVIGAFLLINFSISLIILVDPFTYLIALIPLIFMKIPKLEENTENALKNPTLIDKTTEITPLKDTFMNKFKEGLYFVNEMPGLKEIIIFAVCANFFFQPLNVLLPNFVRYEHNGTQQNLAYIMAALQVGMFAGGIIVSLKKKWKHAPYIICGSALMQYGFYVLFGLIRPGISSSFLFLYIFAGLIMFSNPFLNTILFTFIQIEVPPEKMGRVSSVIMTLANFVSPISMLLAGPLADFLGSIRLLYIIYGILSVLTTFLTLFRFKAIQFMRNGEKKQLKVDI